VTQFAKNKLQVFLIFHMGCSVTIRVRLSCWLFFSSKTK